MMRRAALMAETRIKGSLLAFGLLGATVPLWAPPNSILAQAAVILCVGVLLLSIFEWALPSEDQHSEIVGNPWFWLFFCALFEAMHFLAIYPVVV